MTSSHNTPPSSHAPSAREVALKCARIIAEAAGLGDAQADVCAYAATLPQSDTPALPIDADPQGTKRLFLGPTPEMIEAGAQRLVRWETGTEKWPDVWSKMDVRAARNDAERCWLSMWLAAPSFISESVADSPAPAPTTSEAQELAKRLRLGFGNADGHKARVLAYHRICSEAADLIDRMEKSQIGDGEAASCWFDAACPYATPNALREGLKGCQRDAARYRWLRKHSTQPVEPWSTHNNPESLDGSIDLAMASQSNTEEKGK